MEQGGHVDCGGTRGQNDGEGLKETNFERVPVIDVHLGLAIDAAGPGKGGPTESVEDVRHGVGVVPAGRVLGLLDAGDPLFTGERVGFVPAEEGELGKVSLTEILDLIGHCFIQIKQFLFEIYLKIFE